MKITTRDRKLIVVLPALALLIGYCLMYDRAPNERIKQLRQQIARAQATPVSPAEIVRTESKLEKATRELAAAQSETLRLRSAMTTPSATSSNNAADQVAALLPRHHLSLLEQAGLDKTPGEVSPALRRLAAQSNVTNGMDRTVFWRVKFVGTYLDTMAALDELAAAKFRAIPACMTMTDGPSKGTKTWTLVLWM